jgi:hypothetical protein
MNRKHIFYYLIVGILLLFFACAKESMDKPEKTPENIGTADINPNVYDGYFLYGSNMGWMNHNWLDEDIADILIGNSNRGWEGAGVNSLRPALPEYFVETWGYDNRVNTVKYYSGRGAKQKVVFIGDNPCDQHREGNSHSYTNW